MGSGKAGDAEHEEAGDIEPNEQQDCGTHGALWQLYR